MDLTFQVPMQYCSLQHQTLLLSPVTPTTGCCFCFGSISSLFLELFLHWSPGAYCSSNLGILSFSVLSFCLFKLFMGFSSQDYWSGLPFPSPVLLELSIMTHLSWVALHLTCLLKICMQVRKQQLEQNMEQETGSKWGKEYVKAVYCHPAYLTYMQSTSWEMLDWMKHNLESRFLGEISITSDMQMTPALWQKVKKN